MNLTLSGGTAQQQRWVNDAIVQCSYPLASLSVDVTVQWADPLPVSADIGHAHSYMVTEGAPGGPYTITIATWADDPAAPGNAWLPNPAQDVCDFYKQSLVHELGHVIHLTLITSDDQRTQAASCFWHPDTADGSLRRYGTLADWSASTWGDNVMEAVAECIKCAFYQGRLIYANRTNWQIDEIDWESLMGPLMLGGSGGFTDDFTSTSLAADPYLGELADLTLTDAAEGSGQLALTILSDPAPAPPYGYGTWGKARFHVDGARYAASSVHCVLGVSELEFIGGDVYVALYLVRWDPVAGEADTWLAAAVVDWRNQVAFSVNPGGDYTEGGSYADLVTWFDRTTLRAGYTHLPVYLIIDADAVANTVSVGAALDPSGSPELAFFSGTLDGAGGLLLPMIDIVDGMWG